MAVCLAATAGILIDPITTAPPSCTGASLTDSTASDSSGSWRMVFTCGPSGFHRAGSVGPYRVIVGNAEDRREMGGAAVVADEGAGGEQFGHQIQIGLRRSDRSGVS